MGYVQAGFEVVGIDVEPQPSYPFEFHRGRVGKLKLSWIKRFDAIHASPPCQAYTVANAYRDGRHPALIEPTRELLERAGLPYVIENVPGAPLLDPIQLCGSSFGLRVRRHRHFECSFEVEPIACEHRWQDDHPKYRVRISQKRAEIRFGRRVPLSECYLLTGVYPLYGGGQIHGGNSQFLAGVAMGIDWMNKTEMNDAIPPAYTNYIGRHLKEAA